MKWLKRLLVMLMAAVLTAGLLLPDFVPVTAEEIAPAAPGAAADADEAEAEEPDDTVLDPDEELPMEDSQESGYMQNALDAVSRLHNILLLGIDARPGEKTGRSDTMMVLTVDPEQNTVRLVSLMRDMYVEIPGKKNNRLNAAYVYGGPELLMKTIEQNFGIHVENYVAVNFSLLADLIDQIGGLELEVESDYLKNRINAVIKCDNKVLGIDRNDGLLKESGLQLMTGKQAQAYARYRHGTKDGDFGRTQRQREVILKIWEKLRRKSLVQLFGLATGNVSKVNTNLSAEQVIELVPALLQMEDADIRQLRVPMDGAYSNKTVSGMSVLMPDRSKIKKALAEFYEKD